MKKVYLSKYDDGKPSISKAIVVKETDLSIRFSDVKDLMGWIWISNKSATKKSYLGSEGVLVSESLHECLEHMLKNAASELEYHESRAKTVKGHLKKLEMALKENDKSKIAKILSEMKK